MNHPKLVIGFAAIPIFSNIGAYLYEVGEDIYQNAKTKQEFDKRHNS